MNLYKFFQRKNLNIDITFRCPLECPRCQRQIQFKNHGKKVSGYDISLKEIEKLAKYFTHFSFCGQLSDPVHHPKFIDILKLLYDKEVFVEVHNASSLKSKEWYIKAFKANTSARWVFGIDGLPESSHKYRINQDGVKLFNIMVESKKYLKNKPIWQYIIFNYNENDIEKAENIAFKNDLIFMTLHSARWLNNTDPLMPKKESNRFSPK